MKQTSQYIPCLAIAFLAIFIHLRVRAQVVGNTVELGPPSPTYFQPKLAVDENLLSSLLSVVPGPVLLEADDVLHISLGGTGTAIISSPYDTDVRVERDGTIQLSYINPIKVAGLTVGETEHAIDDALISNKIVLEPAIKVVILKQPSDVIVLSGEVLHPGTFPAIGALTLERVLAMGGGLLTGASPYVMLIRKGLATPATIPLGPDPAHSQYGAIPLLAGDNIQVLRVGNFYVIGAVKNQGAYALKSTTPTTVGEALAMAGGYGYEAILNSTTIVRTEGEHRVMLSVPAAKILAVKSPDIALKNDDILFVPTAKMKAAIKGGAAGLIVSLASTYIYAHP